MKRGLSIMVFFFVLIGFLDCKNGKNQQVIAHVGQAQLTMDELKTSVPLMEDEKLNRLLVERYVQRWLEGELIYQQAIKEKINRQPAVQQQLQKMQKEYIVSTYLSDHIDRQIQVNEDELQDYYRQNQDEFKAEEDLFQVNLILVTTLPQARELHHRLLNGEEFAAVAQSQSIDHTGSQGGKLGYVPLRRLSPLLAAAVGKLSVNELSRPIKSELGYSIVRVQAILKKGQVQPLELVREIAMQRMRAKKQEIMYQKLITHLGDQVDLGTNLSGLSFD